LQRLSPLFLFEDRPMRADARSALPSVCRAATNLG
jgi:hypothetical protein